MPFLSTSWANIIHGIIFGGPSSNGNMLEGEVDLGGLDLIDDSTSLAELLLLISFETGASENDISVWLGNVGKTPGLTDVGTIKKTISTPQWNDVPLPDSIKHQISIMLGISNSNSIITTETPSDGPTRGK